MFFIVAIVSCTKNKDVQTTPANRTDFFADQGDAAKKIQTVLDKGGKGEKLQKIESITYTDSKSKSYAIVFYQSNLGARSIAMERDYASGSNFNTVITCEGANCDCKVQTIIGRNGDVTIQCSCSTCTMVIDELDPNP